MKTMTSNATTVNRQDLLASVTHSQRAEAILDSSRFGDNGDGFNLTRMVAIFGDHDESDALFPSCEVLAQRGYDVNSMASALDCDAITAEELGDLIDSQSVDAMNSAVLTELLRHYEGCELDLGALREAGYDDENIATALYNDVLTKAQLLTLIANNTREDVDTAVDALLQRSQYRWN